MASDGMKKWPSLLHAWAAIGVGLATVRSRRQANWGATQRLIDAARPKLAAESKRLQELMKASQKRLAPLADPLDLDMGLHRWLAAEREEAYSDWLEWIVRQANTANQIFRLFDLEPPTAGLLPSDKVMVQREYCIPYGHIGQEGRLDLVIRCDGHALIVVEVKKGDAEESDTTKHAGYRRWLDEQHYPKEQKHSVLLAASAEDEVYEDFVFLSWETVCINMCRFAIDLRNEGRVTSAALVLAFVAAVEQNLLGFSAAQLREVWHGRSATFNPRVVDHLERFLDNREP